MRLPGGDREGVSRHPVGQLPPYCVKLFTQFLLKKNKAEYQYPNFNYIVCEILRCKVSTQLS